MSDFFYQFVTNVGGWRLTLIKTAVNAAFLSDGFIDKAKLLLSVDP